MTYQCERCLSKHGWLSAGLSFMKRVFVDKVAATIQIFGPKKLTPRLFGLDSGVLQKFRLVYISILSKKLNTWQWKTRTVEQQPVLPINHKRKKRGLQSLHRCKLEDWNMGKRENSRPLWKASPTGENTHPRMHYGTSLNRKLRKHPRSRILSL